MVDTKYDCLNYGGEWLNPDMHYDDTMSSMIVLFILLTKEGWIDMLWNSVDARDVDLMPRQDYN